MSRRLMRPPHHLCHVHKLQQFPRVNRYRRPVCIDAGVEHIRLRFRWLLLCCTSSESGAQCWQEARLAQCCRCLAPHRLLDGAVGQPCEEEPQMDHLLRPLAPGLELSSCNYVHSLPGSRGALKPPRIIHDRCSADMAILLPLNWLEVPAVYFLWPLPPRRAGHCGSKDVR